MARHRLKLSKLPQGTLPIGCRTGIQPEWIHMAVLTATAQVEGVIANDNDRIAALRPPAPCRQEADTDDQEEHQGGHKAGSCSPPAHCRPTRPSGFAVNPPGDRSVSPFSSTEPSTGRESPERTGGRWALPQATGSEPNFCKPPPCSSICAARRPSSPASPTTARSPGASPSSSPPPAVSWGSPTCPMKRAASRPRCGSSPRR